MALNREPLFVALFNRLKTLVGVDPLPLRYLTRRLDPWDQKAPPQQPALCLIKGGEKPDYTLDAAGAIWRLTAYLLVYVHDDGSAEAVIDPTLNAILTAIEQQLEVQPGEIPASTSRPGYVVRGPAPAPTTLGGLCLFCRISGEVEVYEGTLTHTAFMRIPLEMLATA